jgi:hypothetical protein
MLDHTVPSDLRLSLYLSTRLLQELELALQLMGVPSVYVRPGVEGIAFPRLYVGCMEADLQGDDGAEPDEFVCSVPFASCPRDSSSPASDPEWWFVWWGDKTLPICKATNMRQAARIIAEQLLAGSA